MVCCRPGSALLWAALTASLLAPAAARADWQVKRSPFDPEVVARYQRLLERDPHDRLVLAKLIELYRRHRSLDALEQEYAGRANRSSGGSELVVLGHLLRARGRLNEAARRYQQALEVRAGDGRLEESLAELDIKLGLAAQARELYQAAIEHAGKPARKRLLRELANLLLTPSSGLGPVEAARAAAAALEQLLAIDPGDEQARRDRAEALVSSGRPRDAAAEWKLIAERSEKEPARKVEALGRAGELNEVAGDLDAALEQYRRAYGLTPRAHHLRRQVGDHIIGIYRKQDHLKRLIALWEESWPEGSRDFLEWETLGRLYDEMGDAPRAEACWKKALTADPHAIDARKRLLALYQRQGKDAEVIAEYRRLVAAAPGEPRYRLELAERLRRSGTEEANREALGILRQLSRDRSDASMHAALAELYARWGETELAVRERELLTRLEPDQPSHLIHLGELYFQQGKRERALEVWRRLLATSGRRALALARLADVYAEHEMNGESLELYQKAIKLEPSDLELRKGLAGALERVHRESEAEGVWQRLLEDAAATGQRALMAEVRQRWLGLLSRQGLLEARVRDLKARFETTSDVKLEIVYGLIAADAYLKLKRLDDAEQVLRALAARATSPSVQADAWVGLAQVEKGRRRIQEAVQALKKAAELEPSRTRELYAQIAELSLELYRDADALSYAHKSVALAPLDAQAQVRLAELLEKKEQLDEAARALERALELDARLFKVYFTLARLRLRQGKYAEAGRLYRQVIERAPEEEQVLDAARRAIDVHQYLGTLGELEREIATLPYSRPGGRVYRGLIVELYDRYATPLIAQAHGGDQQAGRELRRLGEHGLRPLLDVLSDGDLAEVRVAVRILGELDNPSAAWPLLKLARGPARHGRFRADVDLRVDAAIAAARVSDERSLPQLVELARDDEKNVRTAALYGLGRHQEARAEAVLKRALGDSAREAQALACLGLQHQSSRALGLVEQRLGDARADELVRSACALALGGMAARMKESAPKTVARRQLAEAAASGGEDLARSAAWALGALGPDQAAPALLKLIFLRGTSVRRVALEALTRPAAERALLRSLVPERGEDGLDVAAWIKALPGDGVSAAMPAAWRDHPEAVAEAVEAGLGSDTGVMLRTLGELDLQPAGLSLGPLTPGAMGDQERGALAEVGRRIAPAIERLARHPDAGIRAAALRVAVKNEALPGPGSAKRSNGAGRASRLVRALHDPALEVRVAALDVLATAQAGGDSFAAAELGPALEGALRSGDWRERRAAALAARATTESAWSDRLLLLLTAALDDENGFVREGAARAVGAYGIKGALPLIRHTGDELPEVRRAIALGLCDTRAPQAKAALEQMERDASPAVRDAARAALLRLSH